MAKRILMYSTGNTLGHLRRSHIIATEVLAREPGCSILNLVDAPMTPFFGCVAGLDYVKLPTAFRRSDSLWEADTINLSPQELANLRAGIILAAFREFRPDTVLVDLKPVGVLGDLKPLLDQAIQMPDPPQLFLGIRGIDHDPKLTIAQWQDYGAYDYLGHYDAILVYDHPEIFDTAMAYNLTPYVRQVIYCNYIASVPKSTPPQEIEEDPLILVMGGSGLDVFPMEKAFVDALPILTRAKPLTSAIITGPNMPLADHETLVEQAAPYPVRVYRTVSDTAQLIQRAAVVLTMAGYNSMCEILQFQKKALVVPRTYAAADGLEEQEIRAQIFTELGLIRSLHPTELTPARLAQELLQLIQTDDVPNLANIPPLDGAQRVARLLLEQDDLSVIGK